jgi:hypothetical protein
MAWGREGGRGWLRWDGMATTLTLKYFENLRGKVLYFYRFFVVKSKSNKNIMIFIAMIFFTFYYFHILKSGIVYQYKFL